MHIDLQCPECLARGKDKSARSEKVLNKNALVLGRTRDPAEVEDFYYHMYLPLMRSRHGEDASIHALDKIQAGIRNGSWELLVAKRDGQTLAAGTVEFQGEIASFWHIGVRNTAPDLLAGRIADVVYYHVLTTCRQRGCKVLDLHACRPFTPDGVFEYKRRLGAYAQPQDLEHKHFLDLSILQPSPGAADFLSANPFIAQDPRGGYSLYGFAPGSQEDISARAQDWRERYCFKKTLGLRVFPLEGTIVREPGTGS
ncbi:MAG: GNAT family N-acetyltransferase [Elusimicrobiota bacterium]|jgi:hypothetical protein